MFPVLCIVIGQGYFYRNWSMMLYRLGITCIFRWHYTKYPDCINIINVINKRDCAEPFLKLVKERVQ